MGRYITWADVTGRYPSMLTRAGASEGDTAYVPFAENYVDMGLAPKYSVPFSSNNTTVKDLAIDVCMAKAYMFSDPDKADMIFGYVNSVMGALRDGMFNMITNSGDVIEQAGEPVYSKTMDYVPIFGHGDTADFHVSSAQLYDEYIEREGL